MCVCQECVPPVCVRHPGSEGRIPSVRKGTAGGFLPQEQVPRVRPGDNRGSRVKGGHKSASSITVRMFLFSEGLLSPDPGSRPGSVTINGKEGEDILIIVLVSCVPTFGVSAGPYVEQERGPWTVRDGSVGSLLSRLGTPKPRFFKWSGLGTAGESDGLLSFDR